MHKERIDTFMFFNELDLLEIRLNCLAPYVDQFVLAECPVSHSGQPKPLFFDENKDRFKDFNITHLIVTGYAQFTGRNPWELEHYQREFLMNGINNVNPETLVLLSDIDEIPDLVNYQGQEGVFKQKLYYYYLNTYTGKSNWRGTIAMKRKNIGTLSRLRSNRGGIAGNKFGGWHFSTLGSTKDITYKIESFAHQECNTEEIKNGMEVKRNELTDPYSRGSGNLMVEEITGPKWLVDNQDQYKHLIYRRPL